MLKIFLAVIYGIIFGTSNLIPGLGGGTMMAVFGCYDAVCSVFSADFKKKKDLRFLIPFVSGAAAGIAGVSIAVLYVLDKFPVPSYLFIIGIILGSSPYLVKTVLQKGKIQKNYIFPFLFALAVALLLGIFRGDENTGALTIKQSVSSGNNKVTVVRITNQTPQTVSKWIIEFPEGKVDGAGGAEIFYNEGIVEKITSLFTGQSGERKPNAFRAEEGKEEIAPNQSITFTYISGEGTNLKLDSQVSYKVDFIIFINILLGSFIAAVAMMTPGFSGYMVMTAFGIYATVTGAVKDFNPLILIPAVLGLLGGIMIGAFLIKRLLERYYTTAYCMILGLVIGSVSALIPRDITFDAQTFIGLGAMLIGGAVSLTIGMERRSDDDLIKVSENLK